MKIIKYMGIFLGVLLLIVGAFFLYLNRGLTHEINPAEFNCLSLEEGTFTDFDKIGRAHV